MLDDFMLIAMFCCVGAFGVLLLAVHYWKLRCKCKHQAYLLGQSIEAYTRLYQKMYKLRGTCGLPTQFSSIKTLEDFYKEQQNELSVNTQPMTNLREFFREQQKKHPLK